MAESTGNTVTLFMIIAAALMVILLMLAHLIVNVIFTPKEAVEGTVTYLMICFIGIPFITAYNIISSIFRGMGDSKSPMYFIAVACFANIILDYVFIGALKLGPAGVALGTTVSQAVSVIILLIVIIRKKRIELGKKDFAPQKAVMGKNISFLFLIPSSMLSTVSVLGAQNIGAKKPERAKQTLRYAVIVAVSLGIIVSILMQFEAESVVALFTDSSTDGADVIRLGGQYMRGYIWDCVLNLLFFCQN